MFVGFRFLKSHVDDAAAQADAQPSDAQKEAGNYQKGHTKIGPLNVAIENAKGSLRSGTAADGTKWQTKMPAHYGYVKGSEGADGDHVDVYLGEHAHEADQHPVWVVDQVNPDTGEFDEHKAMVGFPHEGAAISTYDAGFSDGSGESRRGAVTELPFDQFANWVVSGDTKEPLTYRPRAKAA